MSATTMYGLKPIITHRKSRKQAEAGTSCMYEMKNIHAFRWCPTTSAGNDYYREKDHAFETQQRNKHIVTDISEQVTKLIKTPLAEVAVLEARQEKILAQLAELKEQVLCLCDALKINDANQSTLKHRNLRDPISIDAIVNANPERPCWAILGLPKVFKNIYLSVKPYKHSSISTEVPEFAIKEQKKQVGDSVNVSLIWKKVQDTEIIVPGISDCPIIGETNFLRYLVRQFSPERYAHTSEFLETSTFDCILDLAHRLRYQDSPKDVQLILAGIGGKLEKKKWLMSNENAGIADLAAWSAIKQASLSTKLPSNLASWYNGCENMFLK